MAKKTTNIKAIKSGMKYMHTALDALQLTIQKYAQIIDKLEKENADLRKAMK